MKKTLPLLKHAPWSPSKVDKAMQCAYSFHKLYTDRVPRTSNTYARTGVAVHRAQELILEGKKATLAVEQAIEESTDLTHDEKELVQTFIDSMVAFSARLERFKRKHGIEKILLEEKWAITADFEPCDFKDPRAMIRGVVDLAMVTGQGYVIIIDHKSGKKKPVNKFALQLDTYIVMAHAHFPECKGVQAALHFVAHSDIKWDTPRKPAQITKVLRPWLKNHLITATNHVTERTTHTGWWCNWCEFKPQCPAWNENGENDK